MKATGRSVLILDAGDFIARQDREPEKSSLQLMIAAEFMLDAMAWMGYAAANVGEGDLIFGDTFLRGLAEQTSVPLLSASLLADGAGVFPAMHIAAVAGLRVGIVGYMADGFAPYVLDHADPGRPLTLAPAKDALRHGLELLGDEADVRILLAHAPLTDLRPLLEEVPGYDIVISGHDTDETVIVEPEEINGARLVQTGWDGKQIGRLDLTFDREAALTEVAGSAATMDSRWPDHPVMTALHEEYLTRVAEAIDQILEEYPVSAPPTGGQYVGSMACRTCHQGEWDSWRTTKHALAWRTLADRNRDYDPECFACHTTGFQFEGGFRILEQTPHMSSVGCETCHGAGAVHCETPLLPYGRPVESTCQTCHVPLHSPGFDYGTYLPQILHAASR